MSKTSFHELNSLILCKDTFSYYKFLFSQGVYNLQKLRIINLLGNNNIYNLNQSDNMARIQMKITLYDNRINLRERLHFLNYKNINFVIKVCKLILNEPEIHVNKSIFIQIVKYILQSIFVTQSYKGNVIQHISKIYKCVDKTYKMEIIDTLRLAGYHSESLKLKNIDYQSQNRLNRIPNIRPNKRTHKTIYEDSQNVHSTDINQSVLKASVYLIENYLLKDIINIDDIRRTLISIQPEKSNSINKVLERLIIEQSEFVYIEPVSKLSITFRMYDVFKGLWNFISCHKDKDELLLRLIEEMNEMEKYCTTGHLARLINVIQGFVGDENGMIKISEGEDIKNFIFGYLNKELENSLRRDEIIDSMASLDSNKTLFYNFVREKMNLKMSEILNRNTNINVILDCIRKYSMCDTWRIEDGNII